MATSHPIDDVRATVLEQDEKHKLLNEEFLQAPHQLVHPPKDAVTDRSAPILSPGEEPTSKQELRHAVPATPWCAMRCSGGVRARRHPP